MNRVTNILLSVFYLALSWGFSVNVHYCGGKLASVKVISSGDLCCCGSEGMMEGCCSNESIFLKLEVQQQVSESFRDGVEESVVSQEKPVFAEKINTASVLETPQSDAEPPPQPGRSLRIKNCSLITFG